MPHPGQPRGDVLHCLEGALGEGRKKTQEEREPTMFFFTWSGTMQQTVGIRLRT
jgi:hypothetical protein